ncbi:MAG: hypothetical protein GX300_10860 [Tissierellia bacterium]|nr:hypothetical protein [Tissierellia bacterium]
MESNNMEVKNQLKVVENEVSQNVIGMDAEEKERIFKDIVAVQEKAFIAVEQDEFEEDTKTIEVYNEIVNLKKSGAFIPIKGLTPIYVDRNTGIKIFAKRIAKGGGLGDPVLVFVYSDGTTSGDVEIKMYELIEIMGGNRVGADEGDIADAKKMMKKVIGRISSYWDLGMDIRVEDLIKILVANLSTLQVDRGNVLDVDKVYAAIYRYIEKVNGYPGKCYIKRKYVYALKSEDMENIAIDLGAKVSEIVDILNRNNLLHLQASSIGYQSEVKGVGSCYCVRILLKYKYEDYVDYSGNPDLEV